MKVYELVAFNRHAPHIVYRPLICRDLGRATSFLPVWLSVQFWNIYKWEEEKNVFENAYPMSLF